MLRAAILAARMKALRESLAAAGVHTLLVQFTDMHGVAKGKLVPLAHLDDVLTVGAGFSGPSIAGTGLRAHRPTLGVHGARRSQHRAGRCRGCPAWRRSWPTASWPASLSTPVRARCSSARSHDWLNGAGR